MKKNTAKKNKPFNMDIQEVELPKQISRSIKAILLTKPSKATAKKIHTRSKVPAIKKGKVIEDNNEDEAIDINE